jgi:Cu-Zn family superoxide dismutase
VFSCLIVTWNIKITDNFIPSEYKLLNPDLKKYLRACVLFYLFKKIETNFTMTNKDIKGIAVFFGDIKGAVKFSEDVGRVRIDVSVSGLKPNSLHGFHVHEAGDLSDKCTSMCAHFNPYGLTHGCPGMKNRHVGDLGNLKTNSKGDAKYSFYDDCIKLRGTKANIIGRGLIIHEDPDDCGQGGFPDSLTTGHAGKRIACAVIGYSKENFKC